MVRLYITRMSLYLTLWSHVKNLSFNEFFHIHQVGATLNLSLSTRRSEKKSTGYRLRAEVRDAGIHHGPGLEQPQSQTSYHSNRAWMPALTVLFSVSFDVSTSCRGLTGLGGGSVLKIVNKSGNKPLLCKPTTPLRHQANLSLPDIRYQATRD